MKLLGQKWALAAALTPPVQRAQHINLAFLMFRQNGNKKMDDVPKNDVGPKKLHFWPQNHFFGLRVTQLFGIITSPYPEVTLDAINFQVGAHLAAWRAVLWTRF